MQKPKPKTFKPEQGVYFLGKDLSTIHVGTVVDVNFDHPGFVYLRNDGMIWCISDDKVFHSKKAFLENLFETAQFIY